MKLHSLLRTISLSICFSLTACGGGGSDPAPPPAPAPTPTPTPTPPPAGPNAPPVVSFTINGDTFNEGETFLIDASASSDPDGQIQSIVVVHDFNPFFPEFEAVQVNVGNHPQGVFEFLVPEVFVDLLANFDITAEDDRGDTTTESVYLTFRSTVNTPKIDGFGQAYRVLDTGRPLRLLGVDDFDVLATDLDAFTAMNGKEVFSLADTVALIRDGIFGTGSTIVGEVPSADQMIPYALQFNLRPTAPHEFAVISEDSNSIYWFADFDGPYTDFIEPKGTIDIERPCYLQQRVSTAQDFVWVGQRNAGLSVVQMDRVVPTDLPPGTSNTHWARGFIDSVRSTAGGSRSLCFVYPTVLSERLSNVFPQSSLSDLIAIDYDTNELVLFADDAGNDETYEIVDVLPIETGGTPNLSIVDVRGVGTPSQYPRFLLILMSDGTHNGEHRLVTVELEDFTNEISQSVLEWEGGIPIQMVTPGSLFGSEGKSIDFGIDVVIISSTSSEAVIFEDEQADLMLGLTGPPVFKPPQFLEIGSGAGSATGVLGSFGGADFRVGILVSHPDTNELKLWVYRD